MTLLREQARKELLELGLPDAVTAIFDGRSPHPACDHRCQCPFHVFEAPVMQGGIRITPLWECGVCVVAYQYGQPQGRFIWFSLERPDEVVAYGRSFQTAAAALLIDLWEDEKTGEELQEVAVLLRFRHLDRLLSECDERSARESQAEYEVWRARFLESCDERAEGG